MEKLARLVDEVSDPDHASYGKHLSHEDVTSIVSPPAEVHDLVTSWVETFGISRSAVTVFGNNDYVRVRASPAQVEKLLRVKLSAFVHSDRPGRVILRSTSPYTLPPAIAAVVESVDGVSDFPVILPRGSRRHRHRRHRGGEHDVGSSPGESITPPVIYSLYGVDAAAASPSPAQAVAEFEQAYFYPSDLSRFQARYGLADHPISRIVGLNQPNTGYLGECTLDVQYITGVAANATTWMFSLSEFDLVQWATNVTATPRAPKVHSISWGSGESDLDRGSMLRGNGELMKMAAQGYTVLSASGDDGTGATGLFGCGVFDPTYPASSPYITAVGGTYAPSTTDPAAQVGVTFSGGGFSTVFPRPSFQDEAVSSYLSTYASSLPAQQYYNSSGRALPDVSAVSTNFQVIIEKSLGPMSGTSAATPTFAALIALINDSRDTPLGFLNPLLYKLGTAGIGTDITSGNNKNSQCPAGFPAQKGWDAITGLGTPLFPLLSKGLQA